MTGKDRTKEQLLAEIEDLRSRLESAEGGRPSPPAPSCGKNDGGASWPDEKAVLFSIVDGSPFPTWISDRKGTIIRTNRPLQETLNLTDEQISGRYNVLKDINLEQEGVMPLVSAVFESYQPARFGLRWRAQDSGDATYGDACDLFIDVSMFPLLDEGGQLTNVVCQWVDVTEHEEDREALKESERRFRATFDQAAVGIAHVAPDGSWLLVNRRLCQIVGYSREELLELTFQDITHPDDLGADLGQVKQALDGTIDTYAMEKRYIRKDGAVLWINLTVSLVRTSSGEPDYFISVIEDIHDRKRAEEDLRRREEELQQIFEILPLGLWFADRDGTLLRGNPAGVRIWGAEPHVPISEYGIFKAWRLPSGDPVEADDWALAKTIRDGATILDELLEIETFDGKRKTILNYTAPVLDDAGTVDGAIVVNLDISDRTALEEQLSQSRKLESVGRLAGGVAHDFNNMLNVILGRADLVLEGLPSEHPLRNDVEEIQKAADRSANLTRQLLAFARKQTVKPRTLDLNETVGSMLGMLGRLIGEAIDLLWKPGDGLAPVRIDPSQVDQLLANLCVNARDSIGHNPGKVTIETSETIFDEDYCATHAGFEPGAFVMLAVSDDGSGMDEETLAHLFEPFYTTKEPGEGTGLGLATVYGIVKQNRGFVNVYSEPGRGTTFRIYLPARRSDEFEEAGDSPSNDPVKTGTETVLLVEDEPAILTMGARMLELLGYTVIPASSPLEAVRLAEEHPGGIDLLITDVVMPEMNGRELAERLLPIQPDMKRLFMSGYTANVIAHQGVLDAGVQFIQKPFARRELAVKVREVLLDG